MADHLDITPEVMAFFENNFEGVEETPTEKPAEETPAVETVEEVETPVETTPETQETVEEETPTETPVEEEETPNEEVEEEQEPAEDDWETRYKNLQSAKDREVAEALARTQQLEQWAEQQYAWQQQVIAAEQARQQQEQSTVQSVTKEQLEAAVDGDLRQTFQWVVANRPDLVPATVAMVREKEAYGNPVADQMMFEYQQYALAQQQAQFDQQTQAAAAPQQYQDTMSSIVTALESKHGETFVAMREEIEQKVSEAAPAFQQFMAQQGMPITPQAIADFVSAAYLDLREQKLNVKAAEPQKPKKLTPQQHVENPSATTGPQATTDEDAMNELLQGARSLGIDVTAASV